MNLTLNKLAVTFSTRNGDVKAVRDVSFELHSGERLGVVGESGSGKSVMSFATLKVLDEGGRITSGEVTFNGTNLRKYSERQMQSIRGSQISMIFQNPRTALNPVRKVGIQIEDAIRQHSIVASDKVRTKALDTLAAVKIKDPLITFNAYPHQLSGGMCQRILIAIALSCDPEVLIADEPTTGLDITTQKVVMDLIDELIRTRNMSSILITHDLALAAQYCDRLIVMKQGEVVEKGDTHSVFTSPQHTYTRRLVAATPIAGRTLRALLPEEDRRSSPSVQVKDEILLAVDNLSKTFSGKNGVVHAVKNISFSVKRGESVGLVGESGCGKSTTSAMLMRLMQCSSGDIRFDGSSLNDVPIKKFAKDPRRSMLQMVFQDATDSLNPRHTAEQAIVEPILRLTDLKGTQRTQRIKYVCDMTGLPLSLLSRYPHQLSGGQKARVGIARAISVMPKFLVLDEPTAALDVSIQAVVLNLLADLRAELGISYLFISHDLRVVRLLCDSVLVMQHGEIVERGEVNQVMDSPKHPYTQQLLASAPMSANSAA